MTVTLVFQSGTVLMAIYSIIFNLRRLQAKTKVQNDVLDELLYANTVSIHIETVLIGI